MNAGRPAFKTEEVEAFKDTVCRAALELISERGSDGLSFRALAKRINSSHTRVHRYLPNKEAMLDAVRDYAYGQFANALEQGTSEVGNPMQRLGITGRNYLSFANRDPLAFQVLFNKVEPGSRVRTHNQKRAWAAIRDPVSDAVDQGILAGDPDVLSHVFWAAVHGLATLNLTGNLKAEVQMEDVIQATFTGLLRGHGA